MANKEVWETILDYIQYTKAGYLNAVKILEKITQYVFLLAFKINNFLMIIVFYFFIEKF